MKKILFFALLYVQSNFIHAQCELSCYHSDPEKEREHAVDIQHMKVEVRFDVNDPNGGKVIGKVSHLFAPLRKQVDTLFFDAPGIQILKAQLDGKNVPFYSNSSGVVVKFNTPLTWTNKPHELTFEYEANPRKGIYFIGWDIPENTTTVDVNLARKQIWTQGQGIDNRNWIPMYDNMNDKFTTETIIHFDKAYNVLSNGNLLSEKANKDNTKTWHYKMDKPHAGYLLMLAIGKYDVKRTKTPRGTPVNFWYYPEFKERVELTSLYTEKMITFLEDETGYPYPWGVYSQVMVQDFLYGAMENTTATIFGDFFFVNERAFEDRNYIGVNCHELTHQWFGDLITARDSRDIWLHENFATFYAKWFYGTLSEYGPDEVKLNQLGEFNSAHKAAEKDNLPVRHSQSGTARAYPKGSSVLQMLRYVIGDDEFKRAINHYLTEHAFKNVEAADFQNAFKDKLGYNLDWFFEQWVLKGGEPHYKINYYPVDKATLIHVEQIHKMDAVVGVFSMPIQFAVYYTDGSVDRIQTMVNSVAQKVFVPNPLNKKIEFVVFDENYEILKKMTFNRSFNELQAQVLKAKNMADRYEALLALASFHSDDKNQLLHKVITNKNEFHAIQAEAWKQWLLDNKNNAQLPTISSSDLQNAHKSVRQALASNLNPEQENQRTLLVTLLSDKSYQVVETALDNLFGNLPIRNHKDFRTWAMNWLDKTKDTEGMNKAVRIKWLEYGLLLNSTNHSLSEELILYSSHNFEFRTRVNAFGAIQRLNLANEKVINNIFEAIARPNSRLAGPARSTLNAFKSQHAYTDLIHNTFHKQSDYVKKHVKSY